MCKRVERICQVDPEGWYAPVIGEELVRCKDCKLCEVYYHGPEAPEMFTHFCKRNGRHVEGNEFCSRAEVKEE